MKQRILLFEDFINEAKVSTKLKVGDIVALNEKNWNSKFGHTEFYYEVYDIQDDKYYIRSTSTPAYTIPNEGSRRYVIIFDKDTGKPVKKNKHIDNKPNKRGRGTSKTPVIGIKDRTTKGVYAKVALPNKEGKKLSGKQLLAILLECCKPNTTVMTDEFRSYGILDRKDSEFQRFYINHSESYVSGDIHTNGIEGFWSLFKRGFYGTYHKMSLKHMQNYLNEFCFRQNNLYNDKDDVFELLVRQCIAA